MVQVVEQPCIVVNGTSGRAALHGCEWYKWYSSLVLYHFLLSVLPLYPIEDLMGNYTKYLLNVCIVSTDLHSKLTRDSEPYITFNTK